MRYQTLNMAWNFCEYLNGPRTLRNVLWLYTGFVNDSMVFNMVEFVLMQMGYIR